LRLNIYFLIHAKATQILNFFVVRKLIEIMSFFRKSSITSTTNQYFQEQQLQEEEDHYSFGGEAAESQANNIVHTMSALGLNDDNILEPSSRQASPPMSFLRNETEYSSLYAQLTPKSRFISSMPSQADTQDQSSDQLPTKSLCKTYS
jgi:hypothetical protein